MTLHDRSQSQQVTEADFPEVAAFARTRETRTLASAATLESNLDEALGINTLQKPPIWAATQKQTTPRFPQKARGCESVRHSRLPKTGFEPALRITGTRPSTCQRDHWLELGRDGTRIEARHPPRHTANRSSGRIVLALALHGHNPPRIPPHFVTRSPHYPLRIVGSRIGLETLSRNACDMVRTAFQIR